MEQVFAPIDVNAINPGDANGQTLFNQAQVGNLAQAQGQQATQQAALLGKQAVGVDIANQNLALDLKTRQASMQAMREQLTGNGSQPGGIAPVAGQNQSSQGPNPNTPVSNQGPNPNTPVSNYVEQSSQNGPSQVGGPPGTIQNGIAPSSAPNQNVGGNVDPSNPTAFIKHADTATTDKNGYPSTLNSEFLTSVRDRTIALGGDPVMANKAYIEGNVARQDYVKKAADIAKTNADTIKAGADTVQTQVETQQKMVDLNNDTAYNIEKQWASGDQTGATVKAASLLHLDLNTPQGMTMLQQLGNSSKTNLATQEQARSNANTGSEINNRKVLQNIEYGKLAVQQNANLRDNVVQSASLSQNAANTATLTNNALQTQDDLTNLDHMLGSGDLSLKGGSYYVATKNLDPTFMKSLVQSGAKQDPKNSNLLQIDNYMHQIGARIGEINRSQLVSGGASGGGSNQQMQMVQDAVLGNGFDPATQTDVIRQSIHHAQGFLTNVAKQAQTVNTNYNNSLLQLNKNMQPIQSTYVPGSGVNPNYTKSAGPGPDTPILKSQADYDQLPKNSWYTDSSGKSKFKQ